MQVRTIKMGFCNTYLLGPVNEKYVLIDTGVTGKEEHFFRTLRQWNILPEQIETIILTHAHHDHIGTLHPIQKASSAGIIIHKLEAPAIEQGIVTIPRGYTPLGKIMSALGKQFLEGKQWFNPVKPDYLLGDHAFPMDDYGFPLTIIHTPGHTHGSVSVIDNSSPNAFVGDAMFNIPILPAGKIHPPFTDDATLLPKSWENLLNYGKEYYYPAHGRRISRSLLEKEHAANKTSL
ncbi:MAG: MBL fold metallo-hydrolase [Bacteroidales bacterium]|nr:MBL fold metallo-hydrolase [Bacteroidales bacterium]MCF8337754.1 MBL fold metallo-hydrolase [Bacteroidales bacterium]